MSSGERITARDPAKAAFGAWIQLCAGGGPLTARAGERISRSAIWSEFGAGSRSKKHRMNPAAVGQKSPGACPIFLVAPECGVAHDQASDAEEGEETSGVFPFGTVNVRWQSRHT